MSATNASPPGRPRRIWLRVLLGVSLALNLLVLGVVLGAIWRFGPGGDGHRPHHLFGAELIRALPSAERHALRDSLRHDAGLQAVPYGADAAALDAALRARPFDAEALTLVLSREADRRELWLSAVRAGWLEQITQMNDAERAAYAERLQERIAKRQSRRGHRHDARP